MPDQSSPNTGETVPDILDSLAAEMPHPDALTSDWLDSVPVSSSPLDELIDYPSSSFPGEQSVVISTRIPVSWMAQFEEFRDKIGSRMPRKIWKRDSDLLRWFIGHGFKDLRAIQEQMDSGEVKPTPILAAQLFLETTGGALTNRASVRMDAKEKTRQIGEALHDLMADREYVEAADMIVRWFEGARELRDTSTYWESTMISALIRTPGVPRIIVKLCKDGYIQDNDVLELYDGLIERAQQENADVVDNLSMTAPSDESEEEDDQPKPNDSSKNSPRRSRKS